ncbi:MAG: spermidine synthase [Nitrosopumilus sp.]
MMNKKLLLVIFGISGMTALIYEIIWIRPLSLVFGTTMYAVSTIVASFILGLAIGSWIAGRYTDRLKSPLKYFALIQISVGFFGILLLPIFDLMPKVYLDLYHLTFPNQSVFMFSQIIMSMAIITIPATLMGTTLPLIMKIYSGEISTVGKDVGKLDASNSIGAFFGTLAAGFLFIPLLGIHDGILVTATINISLGIIILVTKKYLNLKYVSIIIIGVIPLLVFYPSYDEEYLAGAVFLTSRFPTIEMYDQTMDAQEILFYKESLYQNVMVTEFDDGTRALRLDGKSQCNTTEISLKGTVNLGYLPYSLYSNNHGLPQSALNIGLGCGISSYVLSNNVNTTTIEIDSAVIEANSFFYDSIDHRLIIDDARNWLMRNNEKFDLITSEPTEPWMAWNLYTKEHFEVLSNSVTENGLVAQWIPVYELYADDNLLIMYNTFHSVFPYVYVYSMEPGESSQLIFIGSKNELVVGEQPEYLFDQDDVLEIKTELNTDDKPIIEFETAKSFYFTGTETINFPFVSEEISNRMGALR